MSQMTVTKKRENEKLTVMLDGRADSSTAEQLLEEILNDLEEITIIEINCEKLSFISSSGLRVLLMLLKRIRERGGELVITGPTRKVTEILNITGFVEIFSVKN